MTTPWSCACSPCPNDTFLFGGLATGVLVTEPAFVFHLHDIETLNQHALVGRYDLTKVSAPVALRVTDTYQALPVAAAISHQAGPLLVARKGFGNLQQATVWFPGPLTTAYLLFRLRFPDGDPTRHHFAPYHEIPQAIASGICEAGVVIHESRFMLDRWNLALVEDLGAWWVTTSGLPIPLGICLLRRQRMAEAGLVTRWIRASLELARQGHPAVARFVREHAMESDPAIIRQHLATFVNAYTEDMSEAGLAALAALQQMAADRGLS